MKKIMFNEKYGLQRAAIDGTKPMTRRAVKENTIKDAEVYVQKIHGTGHDFLDYLLEKAPYKVGEVVAIAQSYKDCGYDGDAKCGWCYDENEEQTDVLYKDVPGWNNKMFVKSSRMPHAIRITDVKVGRLQDIRDEDCLREGVLRREIKPFNTIEIKYQVPKTTIYKDTPREAFAALIDKVSGRGTWEKNPWVFVYMYERYDTCKKN